jgi:hypothetical protein
MRTSARSPITALLGAVGVLTGFSWLGPSPDTDSRKFKVGDRAVALARLAECMSWPNRPVDVRVVPDSGEVELIDLPVIQVLGKTPKSASELLVKRYREQFPDRKAPPLRVALVRGEAEYENVQLNILVSLRAMIHHQCPTGPSPSNYQAPPPGTPGLLDNLA